MAGKKSISIIALSFLVFGFFLLALPEKGISSVPQGCCINEATNSCLGCVSGCATQEDFCVAEGGTVGGEGVCLDEGGGGAVCGVTASQVGCCVITTGRCVEDTDSRGCFDTEHGTVWNPGDSCSEVTECTADIPTLSEWGLIAMAGVLGIIGFMVMRRKRVAA